MQNEVTVTNSRTYIAITTRKETLEVVTDAQDANKIKQLERLVLYKDPKGRKMARAGKEDNQVLLHRYLFDIPKGQRLVWINEDTLDLRRENLKLVDREGNETYLQPKDPNSTYEILKSAAVEGIPAAKKIVKQLEPYTRTSEVRGVYFHKHAKKWHAAAFYDGKRHSIGYFEDSPEGKAAAEAAVTEFRKYGPQPKGDK